MIKSAAIESTDDILLCVVCMLITARRQMDALLWKLLQAFKRSCHSLHEFITNVPIADLTEMQRPVDVYGMPWFRPVSGRSDTICVAGEQAPPCLQ